MGYFRDQHWIVEGEPETLEKLRATIIEAIYDEFNDEDPVDYSNYISPVLYGLANGYACLFVPADGSKEGWGTSQCMDEVRESVMKKIIFHNVKNPNDKITVLEVVVDEYKEKPEASWIIKYNE